MRMSPVGYGSTAVDIAPAPTAYVDVGTLAPEEPAAPAEPSRVAPSPAVPSPAAQPEAVDRRLRRAARHRRRVTMAVCARVLAALLAVTVSILIVVRARVPAPSGPVATSAPAPPLPTTASSDGDGPTT